MLLQTQIWESCYTIQSWSRQQAQLFQSPRVQRPRHRCSRRCSCCRWRVPVCDFADHDVVVAVVDRLGCKAQLHPPQAVILQGKRQRTCA